MRVLQDKDYRLFEKLVSLTEGGVAKAMHQYLKAKYDKIEVTKEYIIAYGNIPIALVAHMDTVFKNLPEDFCQRNRRRIWRACALIFRWNGNRRTGHWMMHWRPIRYWNV